CGIRYREWNVEALRQRLGEVGLSATSRADQQDVGLGDLDIVDDRVGRGDGVAGTDALVVVVHRDRQGLLGRLLADDVLLKEPDELLRLGAFDRAGRLFARSGQAFLEDVVAQFDALVADVDPGARDQLLPLLLALAAEGTLEQVGALAYPGH